MHDNGALSNAGRSTGAREVLRAFADECGCDAVNHQAEGRYDLTRRCAA
jgi:hypothetical protein